jgi:hypothetical protein
MVVVKEMMLISEKISITLAIFNFVVINSDRNARIVGEAEVVVV